jgi:hypothetical protein
MPLATMNRSSGVPSAGSPASRRPGRSGVGSVDGAVGGWVRGKRSVTCRDHPGPAGWAERSSVDGLAVTLKVSNSLSVGITCSGCTNFDLREYSVGAGEVTADYYYLVAAGNPEVKATGQASFGAFTIPVSGTEGATLRQGTCSVNRPICGANRPICDAIRSTCGVNRSICGAKLSDLRRESIDLRSEPSDLRCNPFDLRREPSDLRSQTVRFAT